MPETRTPIEVFCSYAQEDVSWFQRLETHLSLLQRNGVISTWDHLQVVPGTDRVDAVHKRLNSASVILLLISADFLASDYCFSIEMQQALQRHQNNQARVIPILLRPVDLEGAPFADLQMLPMNARAITRWEDTDEAFTEVVSGIRRAIKDLSLPAVRPPHSSFPPVWNVPYPRNPFFTGRDQLLTQLDTILSSDQASVQPIAITGLGGVGKTQLAVGYAYRYHKRYQAVFWAQADTREGLVSNFVAAAQLLNLPEKDEQDQHVIVAAFQYWLKTRTEWLLVLDNVDDLALLSEFLPSPYGGHVLLTTRAQTMGALAQPLAVEMLTPEQAVLFLLRRAAIIPRSVTVEQASATVRTQALEIAHELGYLPLALEQAGAYIEETQFNLGRYLVLYRQQQAMLLAHRSAFQSYPNSVATTWAISFQNVERSDPIAADLLRMCAFLHPDAIPEEIILHSASHLGAHLASIAHTPSALNPAIAVLRKYSLIHRAIEANTLSIHRLVQVVLQQNMDVKEQARWAERCARAVEAVFPDVETDSWSRCEPFLPHAQVCLELIKRYSMRFSEAVHLLTKLGWYLKERALYEEAEQVIQLAVEIVDQNRSFYSANSAQLLSILAGIYVAQCRYSEAEPLLLQAQASYEELLGLNHPYTLRTLNNLASLYCAQNKYSRAESLYQRTLALREQHLGRDHPDTADSLNNLASCYEDQGKYEQAEPFMLRALAIYEHVTGPDSLMTARSCNNLAELYIRQKKYDKAEPLCLRAIAIYKQSLGRDHPDTADSMNNLASLYCETGRYDQAEALYQRALAIYEKHLGHDHPDTANSLNNLARLYCEMHLYTQAESLLKRALAICEQRLGHDHPDTANTLYNLARLFHRQGNFAQALPFYEHALDVSERLLGPDHPTTTNIREKYHSLLQTMDQATRPL